MNEKELGDARKPVVLIIGGGFAGINAARALKRSNAEVLLVDRRDSGATGFAAMLAAQPDEFAPAMLRGADPFILIFTSGTTGRAKGVAAPLQMLLQFAVMMQDGFDLQESDVFWCFADPGWALGTYVTLTTPLLLGHGTVLYEGAFTVDSIVRIITMAGVTNLIAAPTVFRMLRAAGDAAMAPIAGQLRRLLASLNIQVSKNHMGAFTGEQDGRSLPHAAGRSRDDGDLAAQPAHPPAPFRVKVLPCMLSPTAHSLWAARPIHWSARQKWSTHQ